MKNFQLLTCLVLLFEVKLVLSSDAEDFNPLDHIVHNRGVEVEVDEGEPTGKLNAFP